MKTLLIVVSGHHQNTLRVAQAMAGILQADIAAPEDLDLHALNAYDCIGFGSGIYSGAHHQALLALADRLPVKEGAKAFVFSTDAPRAL